MQIVNLLFNIYERGVTMLDMGPSTFSEDEDQVNLPLSSITVLINSTCIVSLQLGMSGLLLWLPNWQLFLFFLGILKHPLSLEDYGQVYIIHVYAVFAR